MYSPLPHYYPYYWFISNPKSKQDKVKVTNLKKNAKHLESCKQTLHTFWSYLIRCLNMKWIRLILWKWRSGDDSVHRRTDIRTDDVEPVYSLSTSLKRVGVGYNNVLYYLMNKVYYQSWLSSDTTYVIINLVYGMYIQVFQPYSILNPISNCLSIGKRE